MPHDDAYGRYHIKSAGIYETADTLYVIHTFFFNMSHYQQKWDNITKPKRALSVFILRTRNMLLAVHT